MYWVYVLCSQTTGKRYTGQTEDLDRRVAEHNSTEHNPSKFTSRQAGPWVVVHYEQFATRAEAMAREKWLKGGTGRRWLDEHIGRASPPRAD